MPAKSTLFAQWTTSYHGYVPFEPESHAGALGATYDKMFDNDENTAWYVSELAKDETFSVEFVTKDYVIPNGYVFVTGNASWNDPGRNPKNWKLEAKKSQDGEWVVLDEVTNDTSLPGNARSQAVKMISNNEEYCFFRLTFWGFGAGDDFELSEFCLMTNTTRLPKVTLVPNVNEGESGLIQEGENQSSFNLPKTSTEVIGYVLRNWNTQADGKGQSFGLGDAYQINGDATLYAFRELETYEIIFDANGADPIDSLEYTIESMEKLPVPTREDYFFDGWKVVSDAGNWLEADELYAASTSLTGKYGDVTLKAQWTQIPKYVVTWKNYDGKVLKTDENVPQGTVPQYVGEEPTRKETEEFTYTFTGWDKTPEAIDGDAEYTAIFQETKRKYEITWKMDDGSVIDVTQVEYGTVPTHGDPGKKATAEFTYAFTGWDAAPLAVTGPATYVATFGQTKRSYEITWKMDDGSVIDVETYAYGETPSHADADKAETEEWVYAFTGWKETPSMVTGPATYVATFSATKKASSSLTPPSGDSEDYLDELRKMIQYAISLGGERTITWAKGTGLPYDVLKTLEDHPQITLIFKYEYKNVSYEVTICGKDVETDPTVSWYGPLNLYSRYNLRVNVKDSDGAVKGTYVVRRGDNLSKLARRFNVTVDWLVKKNLIKNPNLIWVNQLLNY